ncbi:MAG TPA: serine-threonine protein kinase [Chloroflexota bacterium]|nr:serine-threonine protein kinase [Chloroflexota bacterium]
MAGQVAGFPFWVASFDESGGLAQPDAIDAFLAELPGQEVTDLFVCSHGWNNTREMALAMYERFFEQVAALLGEPTVRRDARIGVLGVIWPSIRWADEAVPAPTSPGVPTAAAVARPPPATDEQLVLDLLPAFPAKQDTVRELASLLGSRPRSRRSLRRFKQLMGELADSPDVAPTVEDGGEAGGLVGESRSNPLRVFERFGNAARTTGGAQPPTADLGDVFDWLWDGAKEALRQATYWEMKKRAGVVGKLGLGPLLGRIRAVQPAPRLHLVGHSFGGRLVSYALAGLPADGGAPPVASLVLLQGAFSHFAFAEKLPFDPSRAGALAGLAARVDGPLVVTHSRFDTAVGDLYPLASIASGDDASAIEDVLFRWGAMGHDGAQAVDAQGVPFGPAGTAAYPFAPGRFVNLDGDAVIAAGGPPAGAHGDIFHPEIAWSVLAAAGIAVAP